MKLSKATTVDEFVAETIPEARPVIEQIRAIVTAAVPEADEVIGYGKPFYKYHGWMVGILVSSKHLSVEIIDGLSARDREELEAAGYHTGSKTFRILFNQAVPAEILTRLSQEQAERNKAKRA